MKSSTKRNGRPGARICAVLGACMLIVLGLPACTGSALPTARSSVHDAPSAVRQQIKMTPTPESLVLVDETSKSLPVEQYEEPGEACSDALDVEEPLASGYVPVADTEGLWKLCNENLAECGKACRRKKSDKAKSICYQACNKKYYTCLQLAGLVKATFNAFEAAWSWIKGHKAAIAGTIIVVGGTAYLISTGGSGALVLIPLGV